ncbi:hypothetical protein [Nocardia sp. NPDC058666]|uniref:hypothetical protein n=1 Tax=unclassified Nocardia TaxID=2637762 RepID=UPI00365AFD05
MGDNQTRRAAINRLPVPYALALTLRDAGVDDEAIAQEVGIEPQAWATFLAIAQAKLAAAQRPQADPKG